MLNTRLVTLIITIFAFISHAAEPSSKGSPLFWSQAEKETGFPHMETMFPTHTAKRGPHVKPIARGKAIQVKVALKGKTISLDEFMKDQKTAGLLVIQDGRIRLEKYGLGYNAKGRWTSFSVAKSITSTLVGAAIEDGFIKSIDDPIANYLKDLRGSAYEAVSIKQVLTMTSGVKWNENYSDPKSDVALMYSTPADPGIDPTVSYLRKLPREAAPGTKWVYKTGETGLIGLLVSAATHRTLADYLSEKIWRPFGMEQDAVWMVDANGKEIGGCCLSMSLHDYGRVGMFMLSDGVAAGKSVLPKGWIAAATRKQTKTTEKNRDGYGYQWWTNKDGTYDALGIFGQNIHIDPARKLVIVVSSAWQKADESALWENQQSLLTAIVAAVDAQPN